MRHVASGESILYGPSSFESRQKNLRENSSVPKTIFAFQTWNTDRLFFSIDVILRKPSPPSRMSARSVSFGIPVFLRN